LEKLISKNAGSQPQNQLQGVVTTVRVAIVAAITVVAIVAAITVAPVVTVQLHSLAQMVIAQGQ
jgi:hypothetical protein